MESKLAHVIHARERTNDIVINEQINFEGLLLCESVQKGLEKAGFERPSPIQLKAIPIGRCGLDLIVQAKSGTGKTCVFSVIILENLLLQLNCIQSLVLAPTREIAVQITEVIQTLGSAMPQLKCHCFIGGIPMAQDRQRLLKCHIAVGTPGRIKQLIESKLLKTKSVRLFILDEADKLLDESFQEAINWIYHNLPSNKQMLALSATYPEVLANLLTRYMRNPTFIRLNSADPALLGVKQYYQLVAFHPLVHKVFQSKFEVVLSLLASVSFNQCLIFCNYQTSAQNLCELLNNKNWPAIYICSSLDQKERLAAINKLKNFQCRILVSTDLTARGIDAENVNLVINMDVPWDDETYLHRIGRAGRYGSHGVAITLASHKTEHENLLNIQDHCRLKLCQLPDPIPADLVFSCEGQPVILSDSITIQRLLSQKQCSKQKKKKKKKHRSIILNFSSESDSENIEEHKPDCYFTDQIKSRPSLDCSVSSSEVCEENIIKNNLEIQKNSPLIPDCDIFDSASDATEKKIKSSCQKSSIKIIDRNDKSQILSSQYIHSFSLSPNFNKKKYSSYFELKEELLEYKKFPQTKLQEDSIRKPLHFGKQMTDDSINSLICILQRKILKANSDNKSTSEIDEVSEEEIARKDCNEADISDISVDESDINLRKKVTAVKKIWPCKVQELESDSLSDAYVTENLHKKIKDLSLAVNIKFSEEMENSSDKEKLNVENQIEYLNKSEEINGRESISDLIKKHTEISKTSSQNENEMSSERDNAYTHEESNSEDDISDGDEMSKNCNNSIMSGDNSTELNETSSESDSDESSNSKHSQIRYQPSENYYWNYGLPNTLPWFNAPYYIPYFYPSYPFGFNPNYYFNPYFTASDSNRNKRSWLFWCNWLEKHMQYIDHMTKIRH